MNVHWMAQVDLCQSCLLEYLPTHLEQSSSEIDVIFDLLSLSGKTSVPHSNISYGTEFYSQIPTELVIELYRKESCK